MGAGLYRLSVWRSAFPCCVLACCVQFHVQTITVALQTSPRQMHVIQSQFFCSVLVHAQYFLLVNQWKKIL